jgi:16S rRNA (uracil1498-N3)-methyltransferase
MKLHRFFVSGQNVAPHTDKPITIGDPALAHQLRNVFRLKAGNTVVLLDNSGFECTANIALLTKDRAVFSIIDSRKSENISSRSVWLFSALIKKDNFEWVVEKCTELGISGFVPMLAERSEKKSLNMERLRKIATEASEQSERGILPQIFEPIALEEVFAFANKNGISLAALHPDGEVFDPKKLVVPAGILIGPEGGWSENETALFKAKNIPTYSLGRQILRAETAAIAVSSLLLL